MKLAQPLAQWNTDGAHAALQRGYRRGLLGRYASAEQLLGREIERTRGSLDAAQGTVLLGLLKRARADWPGAIDALDSAARELAGTEIGQACAYWSADAQVQSGRLDALRLAVEGQAAHWPAGLSALVSATLRFALGETREALALVKTARSTSLPDVLRRWAVALEVELQLERHAWAEAGAALGDPATAEVPLGFDEGLVRLLVLDARLRVEPEILSNRPGVDTAAQQAGRRALELAVGYAHNMPLYRGLATATAALFEARVGNVAEAPTAVTQATALEKAGCVFEAARVLGRTGSVLDVRRRAASTPVLARARDLLVRAGAFARLPALGAGDDAAPSASIVTSAIAVRSPTTTLAGTSLVGFELEKDVELQGLFDVAREVASTRKVEDVFARIVKSVVKVLKAERAALIRRKADGSLVCVAAQGLPIDQVREGSQELSFGVVRECERTGAAVLTDNALTDERFRNRGSVLASDLRSVACAPMQTGNGLLGFLYVDSTVKARAFTQLTREVLAVFAAQAAISLENALAFEEIEGFKNDLEIKVQDRTRELSAANLSLETTLDELKTTRLAAAEAQRDALEKEMKLARNIQMASVPSPERIDTAAATLAGKTEPASFCGGDFWAWGKLDGDRVFVLVGDVTGHGVAAALLTAVAKSCLDTLLSTRSANTPAEFLGRLNDAIFASGKGELQMTAWMGVLDPATRTLTFANAAHNFPIYVDVSQGLPRLEPLAARGDTLGEEPGATYREIKRPYTAGSALVLFTDGLIECSDPGGTEWGESRLRRLVAEQRVFEPVAVRDAIATAAWGHFGAHPRDDDVTVVVVGLK